MLAKRTEGRKIVVLMMVSLDGVMQSPSGPEEDASNGFRYGGWTAPYVDGALGDAIGKELSAPIDLLLGGKTYGIFAAYWPKQTGSIADPFNKAKNMSYRISPLTLPGKNQFL